MLVFAATLFIATAGLLLGRGSAVALATLSVFSICALVLVMVSPRIKQFALSKDGLSGTLIELHERLETQERTMGAIGRKRGVSRVRNGRLGRRDVVRAPEFGTGGEGDTLSH